MTATTTGKPATRPRAKSRTGRAAELNARTTTKPAGAVRTGDPRADRAVRDAAAKRANAKFTAQAPAAPKPAKSAQPKPLPAGRLTAAEKRSLTRPIASALADLIASLPDDARRPLAAQWVTDSIVRYLPRYLADAELRDPRLPTPTAFAAPKK